MGFRYHFDRPPVVLIDRTTIVFPLAQWITSRLLVGFIRRARVPRRLKAKAPLHRGAAKQAKTGQQRVAGTIPR